MLLRLKSTNECGVFWHVASLHVLPLIPWQAFNGGEIGNSYVCGSLFSGASASCDTATTGTICKQSGTNWQCQPQDCSTDSSLCGPGTACTQTSTSTYECRPTAINDCKPKKGKLRCRFYLQRKAAGRACTGG